jgi:protein-disulfide isomerase
MQLDVDEGIRLGVTVTPAFFINGRLIVGLSLLRPLYLLSAE